MIPLVFDESIKSHKVDKPIYDSQEMIEKYISFNEDEVMVVLKSGKRLSNYETVTLSFKEVDITNRKKAFISINLMGSCKGEPIPILTDEGEYYWMEYITDDDIDWTLDFWTNLMSYWQW
jgi:ribosomal 30S subunit maturation factor RimM